MLLIRRSLALFLLTFILFVGGNLWAAERGLDLTSSESQDWSLILNEADKYLRGSKFDDEITQGHLILISQVKRRARAARKNAFKKQRATERLKNALGLSPGKGMPPEPEEISVRLRQYDQGFFSQLQQLLGF